MYYFYFTFNVFTFYILYFYNFLLCNGDSYMVIIIPILCLGSEYVRSTYINPTFGWQRESIGSLVTTYIAIYLVCNLPTRATDACKNHQPLRCTTLVIK